MERLGTETVAAIERMRLYWTRARISGSLGFPYMGLRCRFANREY